MPEKILPGLVQKALLDAKDLHNALRIDKAGSIWNRHPMGWWQKVGEIHDKRLAEDLLASQLQPVTKEDR